MVRQTEFISTLEAQARLGISGSQVGRLAAQGRLTQWRDPADRRRRIYDLKEVEALAAEMESAPALLEVRADD